MDESVLREIAAKIASDDSSISKLTWDLSSSIEQARMDLSTIWGAEYEGFLPEGTTNKLEDELRRILAVPSSRMKAYVRETQRVVSYATAAMQEGARRSEKKCKC